jgi:hypothetical protein
VRRKISVVWFLISGWVSTILQIAILIAIIYFLKYGWQRARPEDVEDGDNCPSEPRYNFHSAVLSASDTGACLICVAAEAEISIGSGAPAEGFEGIVSGELDGGLSAAPTIHCSE